MLDSNKNIKIEIINLKTNNLYSIFNAIKNEGFKTRIFDLKCKKINSDILIIPGVGSYPKAMDFIKKNHLDNKIKEFREKNKVILGVCLGMQLLFDRSEEFKNTKGLSLIEGKVVKFNNKKLIVPNVGWYKIENLKKNSFISKKLENKYFYFVHSYYCNAKNKNEVVSITKSGQISFCSSVQKKKVFGTQFHPEKSGKDGIEILKSLKKFI